MPDRATAPRDAPLCRTAPLVLLRRVMPLTSCWTAERCLPAVAHFAFFLPGQTAPPVPPLSVVPSSHLWPPPPEPSMAREPFLRNRFLNSIYGESLVRDFPRFLRFRTFRLEFSRQHFPVFSPGSVPEFAKKRALRFAQNDFLKLCRFWQFQKTAQNQDKKAPEGRKAQKRQKKHAKTRQSAPRKNTINTPKRSEKRTKKHVKTPQNTAKQAVRKPRNPSRATAKKPRCGRSPPPPPSKRGKESSGIAEIVSKNTVKQSFFAFLVHFALNDLFRASMIAKQHQPQFCASGGAPAKQARQAPPGTPQATPSLMRHKARKEKGAPLLCRPPKMPKGSKKPKIRKKRSQNRRFDAVFRPSLPSVRLFSRLALPPLTPPGAHSPP